MDQRRYEPKYNKILSKWQTDWTLMRRRVLGASSGPKLFAKPSDTQYGYADPRHVPPALSPRNVPPSVSPEPGYKQYPQPNYYYHQSDGAPYQHREPLQPSNTLYGYADPRHIPPAVSPEPVYKQFPQPNYYRQSDGAPHDPDYKSTRPKEGQRNYQTDTYQTQKFDYQKDDRFHRVPHEQQFYDRSPRHDYHEDYQRSPRRDYQEELNSVNAPRQQHAEQAMHHAGYDVLPPAGRANTYSTKITDLLTSIREPQQRDDHMEKIMEANKGYLVMMRFRQTDLSEVVTAVQENIGTLGAHHGYVIGFAESMDMKILLPSHDMIAHNQWWDPKFDDKSLYAVCCFWFKDVFQAKRWFESANRFKQPDFPNSSPYQVTAVPLTYGLNREPMPFKVVAPITLLWCEFPNIYERYQNDFLVNYSEPARRRMKDFGAYPHISVSKFMPGWPDEANKYGQPAYARQHAVHERVGRSIRTGWVPPKTYITVSTFPSMNEAVNFYEDEYYQEIHGPLNKYSSAVFVAITLRPVKGTTRYF